MVNVEVAAPPFTLTEAGENEQVAPCGRPEHLSATVWANPPLGVSVTVVVVDCPAPTDPAAALKPTVNEGAPATATVMALEVLAANATLPA